jgi:hypothetical protein
MFIEGSFEHDCLSVLMLKAIPIFHNVLKEVLKGFDAKTHIIYVVELGDMLGLEKG